MLVSQVKLYLFGCHFLLAVKSLHLNNFMSWIIINNRTPWPTNISLILRRNDGTWQMSEVTRFLVDALFPMPTQQETGDKWHEAVPVKSDSGYNVLLKEVS